MSTGLSLPQSSSKADVIRLRSVQRPSGAHGKYQMPPPRQRFLVLAVKGKRNDNPDRTGTVLTPSGATVDLLVDLSNPDRRMPHSRIAKHLGAGG